MVSGQNGRHGLNVLLHVVIMVPEHDSVTVVTPLLDMEG